MYAAEVLYKKGICDMHGLYASFLAPVFFEDLLRPRQLENQYTVLKLIIGILRIHRHKQSSPSLRSLVRNDKIRLPFEDRPGIVYEIKRGCNASYIGETGNTLLDRFRDHMKALNSYRRTEEELNGTYRKRRGRPRTTPPIEDMEKAKNSSAVVEHSSQCSLDLHPRIICRESQFRLPQIKESLFIRNNPSINRDKGVEVGSTWTALISKSGCSSIPTDPPPQALNTLSSE
ncbi:hypothetical protein M513_10910 [Trichuris suis]|uniref:GIY-YIG domain-containing protein n=1 Tax=Trichuris suis TaxID=68888 RepID=A0A085LTA0_9BILA|nr:hypothetical protein M513_10910 [Trichuris suis]